MPEPWRLGPPSWELEQGRQAKHEADALPPVRLRSESDGGMPTMVGRFASFGEWVEINSAIEGNFMERMSTRAFEKTIAERRDKIRCLFHHGHDPAIGNLVLGSIRELRADTSYEVPLFDAEYTRGLLPGLRAGVYGASFRFSVVKDELRPHPPRSDYNPKGLREVTVTQADVVEFGPTPFPAYKGASAGVRSTRELVREIRGSAYELNPSERWVTRSKPGCPGVLQRERVRKGKPPSWEARSRGSWWWLPIRDESWILA